MPNVNGRVPASASPASVLPPHLIKVCGITSAAEAVAAVQAGANALGFNFYPASPRYITLQTAGQIIQDVAQPVAVPYLRVGVFVNPTEQELTEAVATVPLDIVQLHGKTLPPYLPAHLRIWQAIRPNHPAALTPHVEAYLLDTPTPLFGGSGEIFDWTLAAHFPGRAIIAGGLDASNVAAAIRAAHPWGVDACSRIESQPGRKDPQRVAAFIQAARAAFESQHSPALPQELTQ